MENEFKDGDLFYDIAKGKMWMYMDGEWMPINHRERVEDAGLRLTKEEVEELVRNMPDTIPDWIG